MKSSLQQTQSMHQMYFIRNIKQTVRRGGEGGDDVPGSEGPGTVHLDGSLEEEGPDQPVCSEQAELVVRSGGKLNIILLLSTGGAGEEGNE